MFTPYNLIYLLDFLPLQDSVINKIINFIKDEELKYINKNQTTIHLYGYIEDIDDNYFTLKDAGGNSFNNIDTLFYYDPDIESFIETPIQEQYPKQDFESLYSLYGNLILFKIVRNKPFMTPVFSSKEKYFLFEKQSISRYEYLLNLLENMTQSPTDGTIKNIDTESNTITITDKDGNDVSVNITNSDFVVVQIDNSVTKGELLEKKYELMDNSKILIKAEPSISLKLVQPIENINFIKGY